MTNRRRNRGASRPRAGAADEANGFSADIAPEKPDEPCPLAKPIWLHPSVSDTLREWSHLYRRLGLILEQLAAHGRTAIVKGCARPNRGWRRSPLGGANGSQYYLWWGIAGSSGPADSCGAEPGTIVVRAVRHHDDHAPLGGGRRQDYLPIRQATDMDEEIAGRPQNRQQASFETDRSPVRVLRGRPGSGKTTALWRAIEARSGEHVLYVTWSARLKRSAEERLAAFAPSTSRIRATDFRTLTGEITGEDVRRIPPADSRRKLGHAIEQAVGHERHPWKGHEAAVYAEVRGRLLGRGVDGEADSNEGAKLAALRPDAYRRQRGNEQGIGAGTAKTLLRLWEKVPESTRMEIFPELAAAAAAARLLSSEGLPEGMEFDRLVVDEAQDLTLTEFWMLLELLRACRQRTGKSPWLLMAGDAGQRVEASGFEWGRYTELLSSRWRKPVTFDLHEHVRCPSRIAAVVNRSNIFYSLVDKNRRPEKQQPVVESEHVTGHALYVRVDRTEQANGLVEHFAALEGTAVITAADEPPAWLDERRRKLVLTPGEAKGLEYQRVCVLDVGAAIEAFDGNVLDDRTPLRQESRRTAIDQLRVALSRATETLAVVNVEPDARKDLSTLALVGGAGRYNQDDIIARFGDETATPEERTSERIRRAEAIVEEDPDRAWEIASQTVAEMGAPDVPNGVSDRGVRRDARATMMRTLALLLAAGEDQEDNVHLRGSLQVGVDMDAETEEEIPDEGSDAHDWAGQKIIRSIEHGVVEFLLTESPDDRPRLKLLEALQALKDAAPRHRYWPDLAVARMQQTLRSGLIDGASDPSSARHYFPDDVEGWLKLTGYHGDAADKACELCETAISTLLDAAEADTNETSRNILLGQVENLLHASGWEPLLVARLEEERGHTAEAREAYEQAGTAADVRRILRKQAEWEEAAALDGDNADLEWLLKVDRLAAARPAGLGARLYEQEHRRLTEALAKMRDDDRAGA